MNRAFTIRRHTIRVVTTTDDYGSGCYRPGLRLFLDGPNGSPNGTGPKAWPLHMRIRRFRSVHRWAKTGWHRRNHGHYGWTNCIYVPLPHVSWAQGYKLRRLGGIRLHLAVQRAYQRVL
jgi:hypothetical protein